MQFTSIGFFNLIRMMSYDGADSRSTASSHIKNESSHSGSVDTIKYQPNISPVQTNCFFNL